MELTLMHSYRTDIELKLLNNEFIADGEKNTEQLLCHNKGERVS